MSTRRQHAHDRYNTFSWVCEWWWHLVGSYIHTHNTACVVYSLVAINYNPGEFAAADKMSNAANAVCGMDRARPPRPPVRAASCIHTNLGVSERLSAIPPFATRYILVDFLSGHQLHRRPARWQNSESKCNAVSQVLRKHQSTLGCDCSSFKEVSLHFYLGSE
jgi:hypothetical protein